MNSNIAAAAIIQKFGHSFQKTKRCLVSHGHFNRLIVHGCNTVATSKLNSLDLTCIVPFTINRIAHVGNITIIQKLTIFIKVYNYNL